MPREVGCAEGCPRSGPIVTMCLSSIVISETLPFIGRKSPFSLFFFNIKVEAVKRGFPRN